jgi:hypothetical protein
MPPKAEAMRARAEEARQAEVIRALEHDLENARPFEALHADLSEQLRAAWESTGCAGTVKGLATLDDVVSTIRADLHEALGTIKELQEALVLAETVLKTGNAEAIAKIAALRKAGVLP